MSATSDSATLAARQPRSSFAGDPDHGWSLRCAVDALAESARAAGRPGGLWLAGIGYPTIGLGLAAGWVSSFVALGEAYDSTNSSPWSSVGRLISQDLLRLLVFFPLMWLVWRLQAGLARISPPAIWASLSATFGRPRLRQAWRAGRGLTASSCGMSLMLTLMLSVVMMLVVSPVVHFMLVLERNLGDAAGLVGWLTILLPGMALLSVYAILLSVLHQLALQSLAHNRRGVSSALVHAWRIARNDPWCTGRTVAVDLLIDVAAFFITLGISIVLGLVGLGGLAVILALVLYGFVGVTRANYWARAYRALGGLSPEDQVPGLTDSGSLS